MAVTTERRFDEARYESAIARRNTAWSYFEAAKELLAAARRNQRPDLTAYVQNYNKAQDEYEWAERDLVRARVHYRADRRWSQEWHGHTIDVDEAV